MDTLFFIVAVAAVIGFLAWRNGMFGKPTGSVTPAKPNPPVFTPAPPVPVESNELAVSYPSEEALRAFLARNPGVGMIMLDDEKINDGFPPAAQFQTQMDGSVRR